MLDLFARNREAYVVAVFEDHIINSNYLTVNVHESAAGVTGVNGSRSLKILFDVLVVEIVNGDVGVADEGVSDETTEEGISTSDKVIVSDNESETVADLVNNAGTKVFIGANINNRRTDPVDNISNAKVSVCMRGEVVRKWESKGEKSLEKIFYREKRGKEK